MFLTIIVYYVFTTGSHFRMYADDYCTAGTLRKLGYWPSQVYWYLNWSGRYSYNLLVHFSEIFRLDAIKILPIILTAGLFVSYVWLARQTFNNKLKLIASVIVGALLTGLMIVNSPNIYQTLYWQTGSLTYFIPFIFLNVMLCMIVKIYKTKKINLSIMITLFLLAFIAGGFSESYVALQVVIICSILILSILLFKSRAVILANIIIIISSIVSLLVMIMSPGSKARQTFFTDHLSLIGIIKGTILRTLKYFYEILFVNHLYLISLLLVFLVGLYFAIKIKSIFVKITKLELIISVLVVFGFGIVSVSCVYAAGLYAMASSPPARTLFMVQYPLLLASLVIGLISGSYIKSMQMVGQRTDNALAIFITILLLAVMAMTINNNSQALSKVKDYSAKWDNRNQLIINQIKLGNKNINVPAVQPIAEIPDEFQNYKTNWVNQCAADYYGVESILVTDK